MFGGILIHVVLFRLGLRVFLHPVHFGIGDDAGNRDSPAAVAPAAETEELPQTASLMPLLALLGAAFIGLAFGLKLILKQAS